MKLRSKQTVAIVTGLVIGLSSMSAMAKPKKTKQSSQSSQAKSSPCAGIYPGKTVTEGTYLKNTLKVLGVDKETGVATVRLDYWTDGSETKEVSCEALKAAIASAN